MDGGQEGNEGGQHGAQPRHGAREGEGSRPDQSQISTVLLTNPRSPNHNIHHLDQSEVSIVAS